MNPKAKNDQGGVALLDERHHYGEVSEESKGPPHLVKIPSSVYQEEFEIISRPEALQVNDLYRQPR